MVGVLHILSRVLGGLALRDASAGGNRDRHDEGQAESFLLVAGLTGFLSGAIFFALQGRPPHASIAAPASCWRRLCGSCCR